MEAVQWLSTLVELRPKDGEALANLGIAYLKLGRVEEAERTLDRAVAQGQASNTGAAWYALGAVYSQTGRAERAVDAWRRAIDIDHRQYDALVSLGLTLSDMGRQEEAVHYFRRFVDEAPGELYGEDQKHVLDLIHHLETSGPAAVLPE